MPESIPWCKTVPVQGSGVEVQECDEPLCSLDMCKYKFNVASMRGLSVTLESNIQTSSFVAIFGTRSTIPTLRVSHWRRFAPVVSDG